MNTRISNMLRLALENCEDGAETSSDAPVETVVESEAPVETPVTETPAPADAPTEAQVAEGVAVIETPTELATDPEQPAVIEAAPVIEPEVSVEDAGEAVVEAAAPVEAVLETPAADEAVVVEAPAAADAEVVVETPAAEEVPVETAPVAEVVADVVEAPVAEAPVVIEEVPVEAVPAAPAADAAVDPAAAEAAVAVAEVVEAAPAEAVVVEETAPVETAEVVTEVPAEEVSQESLASVAWGGAVGLLATVLGPVYGAIVSGVYGPAVLAEARDIEKLEKELKTVNDELAKEVPAALAKSSKKSELSAKAFAQYAAATVAGAVGGFFLPPVTTALLGNELVAKSERAGELRKELTKKTAELQALVKVQQKKIITQEAFDDETAISDDVVAAAPAEGEAVVVVTDEPAAIIAEAAADAAAEEGAAVVAEVPAAEIPVEAAPVEAAVVEEAPALADPDSLEAGLSEVREIEAETDTATEAAGELEAVAAGLESIYASMKESMEGGGLTHQAAEFMHIAVESYSARLGMSDVAIVPSLESFGGMTARTESTRVSMENIEKVVAKIWEALKAQLAKIKAFVIKFLKQVMSAANRLRARAEQVGETAKGKKGPAKANTVAIGPAAARIAVGHDVSARDIAKVAQVLEDAMTYDAGYEAVLEAAYHSLQSVSQGKGQLVIKPYEVPRKAFKNKIAGGEADGWSTDVLPGNVRLSFQRYKKTGEVGLDFLADAVGYHTTRIHDGTELPEDFQARTLSLTEISGIVKAALEIAELADKAARQRDLEKAFTKVDFTVSEDVDAAVAAELKAGMRNFTKAVSLANQATSKTAAYALQTAGAYLVYAQKSLEQYE